MDVTAPSASESFQGNWKRVFLWALCISVIANIVSFGLGLSIGLPKLYGNSPEQVANNVFWVRRVVIFVFAFTAYYLFLLRSPSPRLLHAAAIFMVVELIGFAVDLVFAEKVGPVITEATGRHLLAALVALIVVQIKTKTGVKTR